MKHKRFKNSRAKLPENEKIVGGPTCKKTIEEHKREINRLLKEQKQEL